MEVIIKGEGKEIAALVLGVQGRQEVGSKKEMQESERESLICQYERRLDLLKSGASPGDVIFKV